MRGSKTSMKKLTLVGKISTKVYDMIMTVKLDSPLSPVPVPVPVPSDT